MPAVISIAPPLATVPPLVTVASTSQTATTTPGFPAFLRNPGSLYCWLLARAHTYEAQLVQTSFSRKQGIFGCDDHDVLADYWFEIGAGEKVIELGNVTSDPAWWGSVMNGVPFVKAWDTLLDLGKYWNYCWTIKVDPDTVFLPGRLRTHLDELPADKPVWVRNWDISFALLGPIEIFSALAIRVYSDRKAECLTKKMHVKKSGEDGFISTCLGKVLKLHAVEDLGVLDFTGNMGHCYTKPGWPAMHPFKDPNNYKQCLDAAMSAH